MSSKPPSFQFYARDWAHSVSGLTLEERGAYITFLAWSWEHGQLPNDMKRLSVILGVHIGHARRVCVEVLKKWHIDADTGQWFNRRLEKVRAQQSAFIEKQIANGRLGGRPKGNPDVTQTKPKPQPKEAAKKSIPISDLQSPEDPPTKEQSERAPTRELLKLFDECHQNRFETPAEFSGAKDAALMAAIWRKRGTEETERLIRAFFAIRDPWVVQRGFSVAMFKGQIPGLLASSAVSKPRQVEPWDEECKRLHDGQCEGRMAHAGRMGRDALRGVPA